MSYININLLLITIFNKVCYDFNKVCYDDLKKNIIPSSLDMQDNPKLRQTAIQSNSLLTKSGVTVQLASPWRRIVAYSINCALYYLILFIGIQIFNQSNKLNEYGNDYPLQVWFLSDFGDYKPINDLGNLIFLDDIYNPTLLLIYIVVPILLFRLVQAILMSKKGQSIGKLIMDIKVINYNGKKAGFARLVLVREVIFICLISMLLYNKFFSIKYFKRTINEIFYTNFFSSSDLLYYKLYLKLMNCIDPIVIICVIMLFIARSNRRTLQDYFAGTIVVKATKPQS